MKKEPHKRQPGEYEIRVLKDGRLVLVGPDQTLLDMADELMDDQQQDRNQERIYNERNDALSETSPADSSQDRDE